jgi:hypothetical protein
VDILVFMLVQTILVEDVSFFFRQIQENIKKYREIY